MLRDVTTGLARIFGGVVPGQTVEHTVWSPGDRSGSYSAQPLSEFRPDWSTLRTRFALELSELPSWNAASQTLESYVERRGILPPGLVSGDTSNTYLWPLLSTYLGKSRRISFRTRSADRAIRRFLEYLGDAAPVARCLILLDGFGADRAFRLDQDVRVRVIRSDELLRLGDPGEFSPRRGRIGPRTNWWVCEARKPNARGTADGLNSLSPLFEQLSIALRLFKEGRLVVGPGITELESPFAFSGTIWRPSEDSTFGPTTEGYRLSHNEIRRFVRFWRDSRVVMESDRHYLQLPARRLVSGITRTRGEDALVDYVVALEALLGRRDERTELGYRFRTRGSVLLGARGSSRREHFRKLRQLYGLRSDIVHGLDVNAAGLREMVTYAEGALRSIWKWFFRRWRDQTGNQQALEHIDAMLIG